MTGATTPAAGEAVTPATQTPEPAAAPPAWADTTDPQSPAETETPSSEPAAATPGDETGKKPNRVPARERIETLARDKQSLKSQLAAANAEIARLRQPIATNLENLDYDQREIVRARQAVREERIENVAAHVRQLRQQEHATEAEIKATAANDVFEAIQAAAHMPGLWDKFTAIDGRGNAVVPTSDAGADFIAESDKAVELIHFLTSNPKEAVRIYELPLSRQISALARIEGTLNKAPSRKATTAPNPGTVLNGGTPPQGATVAELAESDDMGAYIAARKAAWAKGK